MFSWFGNSRLTLGYPLVCRFSFVCSHKANTDCLVGWNTGVRDACVWPRRWTQRNLGRSSTTSGNGARACILRTSVRFTYPQELSKVAHMLLQATEARTISFAPGLRTCRRVSASRTVGSWKRSYACDRTSSPSTSCRSQAPHTGPFPLTWIIYSQLPFRKVRCQSRTVRFWRSSSRTSVVKTRSATFFMPSRTLGKSVVKRLSPRNLVTSTIWHYHLANIRNIVIIPWGPNAMPVSALSMQQVSLSWIRSGNRSSRLLVTTLRTRRITGGMSGVCWERDLRGEMFLLESSTILWWNGGYAHHYFSVINSIV